VTPRCLIFLHLPKTAGSTLTTVLRWQSRRFGPEGMLRLTSVEEGFAELDRLSPEQLIRLRVLMGHFPYGVHEHLPMPSRYITMIRDPVKRVVSVYRFVLSRPAHPVHGIVTSSSMTLDEYVTSGVHSRQVENALTRQLAGIAEEDDEELTDRHLQAATANLQSFLAVGLTERFDESLILFKRILGWSTPFYFSRNVSRAGPSPVGVSSDVLERIAERNALDLQIYELARSLFRSNVEALDDGFDREVRRFKRLNWAPNALRQVLEPIAPRVRRWLERRASRA
jgi:hypothetical protein